MTDVVDTKELTTSTEATTNTQKLICKYCKSTVLLENIGKMVYDRSWDVPLMMQKKDISELEKENITKFLIVEKVFDFENVGVSRSHEGRVYLTCSECEMGPIGLKDPDSTQYLIAIERLSSS